MSGQIEGEDFAGEAVREALSLCVSCKGCKRECPTGVDVARMKIEHTAEYKRRHGFTRRDKLVAHLPRYSKWMARLQPLLSVLQALPGAGAAMEAITGFDRRRPLPKWKTLGPRLRAGDKPQAGAQSPIVLFADTFNYWFEPENLAAARKVLEATGHRVITTTAGERPLCCGRTYLTTGMMDEARAEARRTMHALREHLEAGTPIVGLEPSCVLTFRDEYAPMFPGDALAARLAGVQLLDEYLDAAIRGGRIAVPWRKSPAAEIRVHGHCHQKAFGTFDATLSLLRTLPGAKVTAIESSCCGMAGSFGHEHYDVSMKMGELALLPAVRAAPDALIAAAGTSCRQQIAHGAAREARHPLVILADAL